MRVHTANKSDLTIATITFIFFLVYPLYSLGGTFYLIYRKNPIGFLLLSLFLGLLAFSLVPRDTMDLATHYAQIESLRSIPLHEIPQNVNWRYLLLYGSAWGLHQFNLKENFVPLFYCFISYAVLFRTFQMVTKPAGCGTSFSSGMYILLFAIVLMNSQFWHHANGIRTGFSFSLIAYAIVKYEADRHKLPFFLLSIIAFLMHPAGVIPVILFVFTKFYKNTSFYQLLLPATIPLFIIGDSVFYHIAEVLKPVLSMANVYSESYFDVSGEWAGAADEHLSLKGKIYLKIFQGMPFYIMATYLFLIKQPAQRTYYNFLCLQLFTLSIVVGSHTVFYRLIYFFTTMFCFYLAVELTRKPLSKLKAAFVTLLTASLMIYNAGTFYSYSDIIIPMFKSYIFKPLPIIFLEHL